MFSYKELSELINITEILTKDGLENCIDNLKEEYILNNNLNKEIPYIGTLIIKENIAAIKFNDDIMKDCSDIKNKIISKLTESNLYEHSLKNVMSRSTTNLPSLSTSVSTKAINWLNTELGITFPRKNE